LVNVISIAVLFYIMFKKAKWIWIEGERTPKNFYLYARKTFNINSEVEEARIKITADSKYVLFINGNFIGMGPIRGWPFEYYYDVYDVKPYLKKGKNVIAILAQHYGISSFKYVLGEAGILAELEFKEKDGNIDIIATDETWKVKSSESYIRNVPRISCQQEWVEQYDARKEFLEWNNVSFDDSSWQNATIIGEPGITPWKKLVKRDIPLLLNQPIPPVKIIKAQNVEAPPITWYIDLRNNLLKGYTDANPKEIIGFLTTIIESSLDQVVKLRFVHPKWHCPQGPIKLNGIEIVPENEAYNLPLKKGKNLLLINVTGSYHKWGTSIIFYNKYPISFNAPLGLKGYWATIGPFTNIEEEDYKKTVNISSEKELEPLREYVKPVAWIDYTTQEVFAQTAYRRIIDHKVKLSNESSLISFNEDYMIIYPTGHDIEIMFDFGKELYGPITFEVNAHRGVILDWNFFEKLEEDYKPRFMYGLDNTLRYICRDGFQKYRGIVGRGFRYATLTIRNLTKPLKIRKIACILNTYPVLAKGSFDCSNELLNRIWDMSSHTLKVSMLDTYVDCPTYEQTLWVGDARIEALVNYYAFGDVNLTKRCILLAAKSLHRSPLPESQVPSGWQDILSTWSLLWVLMVDEYLQYTNDNEFLKEIYPYVKKTLDNLEKYINEQNLLSIKAWNMLDWAPMDTPREGIVTHLNIFAVEAFRRGAKLAEKLTDTETKEKFLRNSEKLRKAIISELWNSERKGFIDSIHVDGTRSNVISVATNALAVLYDCVSSEQYSILRNKLLDWPEDWVKPGSPYGMFFVLEALEKLGYKEKIIEEIKKNWKYMLHEGPGTCWETFKKARPTRSYCHGWSSGPLYFLSKIFLGLDILEINNDILTIKPETNYLDWAKGGIPTSKGIVYIDWIKNDDSFHLTVKTPFRKKTIISLPLDTKIYKDIVFVKGKCKYDIKEKWYLECDGPIDIKVIIKT